MTWLERARRVVPGAAQTNSKSPGRVGPIGAFPLSALSGEGPYLLAEDGREYLDFFNSNCAITLGHGNRAIRSAIVHALDDYGTMLSLPHPLECEVAERLRDVIPCAEQTRFVKTGSEACHGAARIARMATGRDVIVSPMSSYHGWHNEPQAKMPDHPGVPQTLTRLIRPFTYNDLVSLEAVVGADVAAVMLEPTKDTPPAPGFLAGVRDIAHQHGALLIWDCMITGARWDLDGGMQRFGVVPDLATFGKAFAQGMPLGFICGNADLMRHAWAVSGTFGGELLSLAACLATLNVYRSQNVIEHLWAVGEQIITEAQPILEGGPVWVDGAGCHPVWTYRHEDQIGLISLWQQCMAESGVLGHYSAWNPSLAHQERHVEQALQAIENANRYVLAALKIGRPIRDFLRGEPIQMGLARPVRAAV